jgi:hypothetical protein
MENNIKISFVTLQGLSFHENITAKELHELETATNSTADRRFVTISGAHLNLNNILVWKIIDIDDNNEEKIFN